VVGRDASSWTRVDLCAGDALVMMLGVSFPCLWRVLVLLCRLDGGSAAAPGNIPAMVRLWLVLGFQQNDATGM
jgi:hypothetical protein